MPLFTTRSVWVFAVILLGMHLLAAIFIIWSELGFYNMHHILIGNSGWALRVSLNSSSNRGQLSFLQAKLPSPSKNLKKIPVGRDDVFTVLSFTRDFTQLL